jgi:hypothetical protein
VLVLQPFPDQVESLSETRGFRALAPGRAADLAGIFGRKQGIDGYQEEMEASWDPGTLFIVLHLFDSK